MAETEDPYAVISLRVQKALQQGGCRYKKLYVYDKDSTDSHPPLYMVTSGSPGHAPGCTSLYWNAGHKPRCFFVYGYDSLI